MRTAQSVCRRRIPGNGSQKLHSLVDCSGAESCRSRRDKLFVHVEQGNNRDFVKLLAAFEEWDLDDEKETSQGAPKLLDQVASGSGRTTCEG